MPAPESNPANSAATEILCPACGYDLRGIESDRCPECGEPIDEASRAGWIIPWAKHGRLGHVGAFWKTIWLATFRTRALAGAMNAPVRLGHARLFRWAVVLHVLLPAGLAVIFGLASFLQRSSGVGIIAAHDTPGTIAQVGLLLVCWGCLTIFLLGVTGIASYFFHPRGLSVVEQNRAVALSYYACAPLTPLAISMLWMVAGVAITNELDVMGGHAGVVFVIVVIALAPLLVQVVLMIRVLRVPVVLLGAVTGCGRRRQWCLGIALPLSWIALAAGLGEIIAMYWKLALMAMSLRS